MSKEVEDHRIHNRSGNLPFAAIVERRLSRRSVMCGGLGLAAATMLGGFGWPGTSRAADGAARAPLSLGFASLAPRMTDAVVVPEGYVAQVLIPWGTPLVSGMAQWHPDLDPTPEFQAASTGMHHDGMYHFALDGADSSDDFLLVLNHEYLDQSALWAARGGPTNAKQGARPLDEARTEINAHGVCVVRVRRDEQGHWAPVLDDPRNRRITTATPMLLAGPLRGSRHAVTAYSPQGTQTRGTNNNCACGYTPWGTYLTCEENWSEIFVNRAEQDPDQLRLGLAESRSIYGWETVEGGVDGEFERFDNTPRGDDPRRDYRNEARTYGYVVEIDPYDPERAIYKRTALGRFRHEGCWPGKLVAGQPVVFYTGHDARNEYIYKFVSRAPWDPSDANRPGEHYDRQAIGAKYMDHGTLYVARFDEDGSGEWLPLAEDTPVPGQGRTLGEIYGDLAGIIVNTCDAADLLGATPMDRPEWGTVDPSSGEVYMSLTNNSKRTEADSAARFTQEGESIGTPGVGYATAPVNAANPRPDNDYGQVIRWLERDGEPERFDWEIFVFGAAPGEAADNRSGLDDANAFASPDGLWYDQRGEGEGILWIQTDNGIDKGRDNAVAEMVNDQVLAVVPGALSRREGAASVVDPSNQAELKRFAIVPNQAEVTGIFATPDRTALFINVQHPGNWPAYDSADATLAPSAQVRPRSSTVVIQRRDGGRIGEA